jgi:acetyltransferase-like isoleucine patch superfamily enzyme/acyl carrier protein
MFWDLVELMNPTWYYATPTMHQMILAEAERRPDAVRQSAIKSICNAGGGLPPTLAAQLRSTFQCVVLPSYGMTECMPIAAPPADYSLDRPGTSGRIVGPELAILADAATPVPHGTVGRICIRGSPVFEGYLQDNGTVDPSAFDAAGWFDTGDLGYLDADGYLYITGRSKEVINRGGEIISPVEVEDAVLAAARDPESLLYGSVSEALAFSAPDEVLQEVVGLVIVTPPDRTRPDIRQLQEALQPLLQQAKWPNVVVYMDRVPSSNNKMQRIKLAQRLGLDPLTETTPAASRHFEADCPPAGTQLSVAIPKRRCGIDEELVREVLMKVADTPDVIVQRHSRDGFLQAILFVPDHGVLSSDGVSSRLRKLLHGYLVPSRITLLDGPMPVDVHGYPDHAAIAGALRSRDAANDMSPTERRVREIFAIALACTAEDFSSSTDFFHAGGDSLSAGRLVSQLRHEFGIFLPGDVLFRNSTVGALAARVSAALDAQANKTERSGDLPGCTKTYSSTNPLVLILQLVPMVLFSPMKRAFRWILFAYIMAECIIRFPIRDLLVGRLLLIILAVLAARFAEQLISPLCGILFKWMVIGRYREGLHPMWGPYHMRWWLTQKALQVTGRGFFNRYDWSRVWYYRLLGARIGGNVLIHPAASLGEYDLIDIGDNVVLDPCQCRPFAVERNTSMLLKRIRIAHDSTIGLKATVAPGAVVPPNTCIGPNSSSWEMDDADEANRDLLVSRIPKPHWAWNFLIVEPLRILVWVASRLTWMGGLVPMVRQYPGPSPDMFMAILQWFTSPQRIGLHIVARICRSLGGPIVLFASVLLVKTLLDVVCGRPQPRPASRQSERQKVRSAVLAQILPAGDMHELTRLIGRHYELVSMAVRALGGRVGKRVYWPSVGPAVPDFDLVTVGNDVVFGSRSHLVTSDGYGRAPVVIEDGAMVGDRSVVLPGASIGREAMIGSGALLRRNGEYAPNTVWTGSKRGDAVQFPSTAATTTGSMMVDDSDRGSTDDMKGSSREDETCKPFGRAFYHQQADYRVLRLHEVVAYSVLCVVVTTVYWLMSVVFSLFALQGTLTDHGQEPGFRQGPGRPFVLYGVFAAYLGLVSAAQSLLALLTVIGVKWLVLGRRQEGAFHWDESSYNQRWQFLLSVETLIKDCHGGAGILPLLSGSAYLVWYYRALGATIGDDCAIHANGTPSLFFTEPDLLTLGNRVAVDDASLVCHLNSRGEFELHTLDVGDRSILRAGSRLMSGASMGRDACLLEHTLVLSGDHVEDEQTLQGWPAEAFDENRV